MYNEIIDKVTELVETEQKTGHCLFDFDDLEHDRRQMAEVLDIKMVYDEDEEEYKFKHEWEEEVVRLALDYYYNYLYYNK